MYQMYNLYKKWLELKIYTFRIKMNVIHVLKRMLHTYKNSIRSINNLIQFNKIDTAIL